MKMLIVLTSLALSFGLPAHAERVKIDLTNRRIFAGFSDVQSEYNRIHYADAFCRYMGFRSAGDYSDGYNALDPNDKQLIAVFSLDPNTLEPVLSYAFPNPKRSAGIYTKMECER